MKKNKGKVKKIVKNKIKYKTWEKLFIIGSVLIMLSFFVTYSLRAIIYYRLEHPKIDSSDKRIISVVRKNNNVVSTEDGLYKEDDNYYFKGTTNNNYVFFQGRLYRIMFMNDISVTLITDSNQTSIVKDKSNDYEKSLANTWLNDYFLKSIDNYEDKLLKKDYCIDEVTIDNITCNKKINSYVGLLSLDEYLKVEGSESYLNNNTYFWLSNYSNDSKSWYVFDKGGINDNSNNNSNYNSYGIRPVINIKSDLIVHDGDGTFDNPYYLDDNTNTVISSKAIGSYVLYSNYKFRILSKDDNSVKLVMDEYIKSDDKNIAYRFDSELTNFNKSDIYNYLNNTIIKKFNKSDLNICTFNYGNYNQFEYKNAQKYTIKNYVGLLSIGEFFTNDSDTWLTNSYNDLLLTYKSNSNGTLYAEGIDNKNTFRPVICLKNDLSINGGLGTLNNPYTMEANDEITN